MTATRTESPTPPAGLKLNLGAGHQRRPGWICYDRSRAPWLGRFAPTRALLRLARAAGIERATNLLEWPADTRVRDLTRGIPHETGSVECIYTSHALEHLPPADAELLLMECLRVLRPGGGIRVVVPDLAQLVEAYRSGDVEFFKSAEALPADALMGAFYNCETHGASGARLARWLLRTDDGGHRWMYDFESLSARLARIGFTEIRRRRAGEGTVADASAFDDRSPQHIHLEAFKP